MKENNKPVKTVEILTHVKTVEFLTDEIVFQYICLNILLTIHLYDSLLIFF